MKKILVFGTGKGKTIVERCLVPNVEVAGYIDNYYPGKRIHNGKTVICQEELAGEYDYLIISLMDYQAVKNELMDQKNVEPQKIICFFDENDASNELYWEIIDGYKWRFDLLWKHYKEVVKPFIENAPYELYANTRMMTKKRPKILSAQEAVDRIVKEKKSLARFGDNEFEIIFGRVRTEYQDTRHTLSERLQQVLHSDEDNLLIAIADNYGSLEKYTDQAASAIRLYLSPKVREEHLGILDLQRQYYDAYLSRPYYMYRDRENAAGRFEYVKSIWDDLNVLVVEGEHTRFGVGNDLLQNADSVCRVVVPDKNAFDHYDQIIDMCRNFGKARLILAILGAAATVLAYDLSKEGYWVIDIGQLDTEYEWFLRGGGKCSIPGKTVSEIRTYGNTVVDMEPRYMEQYRSEIIGTVGIT